MRLSKFLLLCNLVGGEVMAAYSSVAKCKDDACLKAVKRKGHSASNDCKSHLVTTVTPTLCKIVTVTTTFPRLAHRTPEPNLVERNKHKQLPSYAEQCGASCYTSACSCIGVTPTTKTVYPCTRNDTVVPTAVPKIAGTFYLRARTLKAANPPSSFNPSVNGSHVGVSEPYGGDELYGHVGFFLGPDLNGARKFYLQTTPYGVLTQLRPDGIAPPPPPKPQPSSPPGPRRAFMDSAAEAENVYFALDSIVSSADVKLIYCQINPGNVLSCNAQGSTVFQNCDPGTQVNGYMAGTFSLHKTPLPECETVELIAEPIDS